MPPPIFSAVLLAGGRSTRMGVDKATLTVQGVPLWRRQLNTLRETGASVIAVAGRRDGPFAAEVVLLEDEQPGLGPLSGIVSGLRWCATPLLLVLAVDLPAMTPGYLRALIASAGSGCGAVPQNEKWFEPLAAVYPREALPLAEVHLAGKDRSLQGWVRACESAHLIEPVLIGPADRPLFANLNTPDDVRAQSQAAPDL